MQSANPATYNRAGTDTKRFVLGSHTIRPVADRDPGAGPRSGAGMAFSSRPRPRPHFTNWPGFCGRDPGRRSPVWCRDSILIPAPAKLKNWPGFWPGIYHLQYKIANYF